MEVFKSNKGKDKISYEGYMYVKKKENKDTSIRWNCAQNKALNCRGAMTTDIDMRHPRAFVEHTHQADRDNAMVSKVRSNMKDESKVRHAMPSRVLAQSLLDAPHNVRANIGNLETIRRDLRRQKQGTLPRNPPTRQELDITEEWTTTGGPNPLPFLIYDSGQETHNRIIIYSTNQALNVLARANKWFMDGNFALAPTIFAQLYVIRAELGSAGVSCVYAFLPGKTQAIYEEMLQVVIDKCQEIGIRPRVTSVISDFEIAAINAIDIVIGPPVRTMGCFFHLCQSTWRKIQELGLTNEYKDNEDIRMACGMLDALAFLPIARVVDGMAHIRAHAPDVLDDLINYFDNTYVNGAFQLLPPANGANADVVAPQRLRRQPPMFPPTKWNVNAETLGNEDRTNNICEGWNNLFRQLVGHNHPTFWVAVQSIRKDAAIVSTVILQDERGEPPRRRVKRTYQEQQRRLRNLCEEFNAERRTLPEFMRAVAHTIKF